MNLATAFGLAVAWGLATASGAARADSFAGFSGDETRFLRGADQVCEPLAAGASSALPRCRVAGAAEVARLQFQHGRRERGKGALFRVRRAGKRLELVAGGSGRVLVSWTSPDPIVRVLGVYSSPGRALVAVDMEVRRGGTRRSSAIAFALADRDSREAGPALDAARRYLAEKQYRPAERTFRAALAAGDEDPEARYGLAVALMHQRKRGAAIAELAVLSRSEHPEAIVWMIEARFADVFAQLRRDVAFRRAVGLVADGERERSAYERLVGLGGHWEAPGRACEAPEIDLQLERRARAFGLHLRSKCRGVVETTRLDGHWTAEGTSRLMLTFPNPDGREETMTCELSRCQEGQEDCLRCAAGTELEMSLRLVRR